MSPWDLVVWALAAGVAIVVVGIAVAMALGVVAAMRKGSK